LSARAPAWSHTLIWRGQCRQSGRHQKEGIKHKATGKALKSIQGKGNAGSKTSGLVRKGTSMVSKTDMERAMQAVRKASEGRYQAQGHRHGVKIDKGERQCRQ